MKRLLSGLLALVAVSCVPSQNPVLDTDGAKLEIIVQNSAYRVTLEPSGVLDNALLTVRAPGIKLLETNLPDGTCGVALERFLECGPVKLEKAVFVVVSGKVTGAFVSGKRPGGKLVALFAEPPR